MTRTPLSNSLRLAFGLLAFCCCASAFAQPSSQSRVEPQQVQGLLWIGDLDTNHDARISREEAAAAPAIANSFDAIDTRHQGFITMSEMRALWHSQLLRQAQASVQARVDAFEKADTNHDGKLSLDEAKTAGMTFVVNNFKAFDSNHDGYISRDEMQKGAETVAQQALNARTQRMHALFVKADTNHDGKLSKAEFTAAFPRFARSFAFIDENHHGFIESSEFELPPGF